MSSDFTSYLDESIKQRLENLYGKYYQEIVDCIMRKIAKHMNKMYLRRYGISIDNNDDITSNIIHNIIYLDTTPIGYLYGNSINQTYEWKQAEINEDEETLEYLFKHKEIEEAKYKAKFITFYIDELWSPVYLNLYSTMKASNALLRREKLKKIDNFKNIDKKHCDYDWI